MTIGSEPFLIENKCHLDEANKWLFLINADAADPSQSRGARSCIPIIVQLGAAGAVLGRPILVQTVISRPRRSSSYGNPARWAALTEVSGQYFGRPIATSARR